ncbi:hypothetical protein LCGC14_3095500, partial [marine sediment metagenome]
DNDLLLDGAETDTGIFVNENDAGTDPLEADTDADGFIDGLEISLGTDPLDITDTPTQKLLASDGQTHDYFGSSVSIDGDTMAIGAYGVGGNAQNTGAVYVFTFINDRWVEQAKLTVSDPYYFENFGSSVSMDGDSLIVGANGNDENGSYSGAAYVFVRENNSWTERAKLMASDGAPGDYFGISVSIDGDTAVIGAYGDEDGGSDSGAAYVFFRDGSGWIEQAKLISHGQLREGDKFGEHVSIDGDTIVVGAPGDVIDYGAAYVFTRNNGLWSEQGYLRGSDPYNIKHFGQSVAIDGDTIAVGASDNDNYSGTTGFVYVFTRNNEQWTQHAKLSAGTPKPNDKFGWE